MRVADGGQRLVLIGKVAQGGYRLAKPLAQVDKPVTVEDQVCVIGDIAARCAEVDDARSVGRRLAVGVDVRHDIMAHFTLPCGNDIIIDIIDMSFKLLHLLLGHRQPQLMLASGKLRPQSAPCAVAHIGRKQVLHVT